MWTFGSVCPLCKSLWMRVSAKWLKCKCRMTGPGDVCALDECLPRRSGLPLIKKKKRENIFVPKRRGKRNTGICCHKSVSDRLKGWTVSKQTPWCERGGPWAEMKQGLGKLGFIERSKAVGVKFKFINYINSKWNNNSIIVNILTTKMSGLKQLHSDLPIWRHDKQVSLVEMCEENWSWSY